MTYGYIYKIVFPNKKHYIGLTTSIKQRTTQHKQNTKTGDTKCVYNALRKYEMVDTLELIEIDTADTNEELCQKEIEYIIKYNSYYMNGNGYNMTYGGEGTKGYVFTEEDNKKNSERLKKYHKNNPEVIREYYKNNPEKGKEHGERLKLLYKNNPEKKQLMSELKNKQYENNPEIIQLMSELKIKYYKNNPEARQRASEITTKQFENPAGAPEGIDWFNMVTYTIFELQKLNQRVVTLETMLYNATNPTITSVNNDASLNSLFDSNGNNIYNINQSI